MLLDDLIEQGRGSPTPAPGEWVERCRATLAALLDWFAADPPAGRFLLVELAAVGPEFHERFEAGFDRFVAVIDSGLDPPTCPTPARCRRPASPSAPRSPASTSRSPPAAARSCPRLLPQLTYEVLVPFLGEDAAREAALRGRVPLGRGRGDRGRSRDGGSTVGGVAADRDRPGLEANEPESAGLSRLQSSHGRRS